MNNWFRVQVNEILCNGMTNSELGLYIKYKALCEHFKVDSLTWQKIEFNFDRKEQKVISKLFGITPEVDPKLVKSLSEVHPELVGSSPEVSQKSNNKNNDLATPLYIDKTRQDNTRQDNTIQESSDKSPYVFSGKVIHLDKKDFDEWSEMFPDLNLRAELMVRDKYLAEQSEKERKNWFISTSQYFIKQNERRKAQNRGFDDEEQEDMEDWLRRSVR